MIIPFSKYDGAGNDFVVIDNRSGKVCLTEGQIARVCHRRRGVGADGLILLGCGSGGYDFTMRHFNSDGRPADMCGNGGRCIAAFAHSLGLSRPTAEGPALRFLADDGPHEAVVRRWDKAKAGGVVTIGMRDVEAAGVERRLEGWLLNTGVPHYVQQVADLEHYDVVGEGRRLRHHPDLGPEGANVNFVEPTADGRLRVRTYERGVEDETWACGTGVTACAIVTGCKRLFSRGGDFEVAYALEGGTYRHVRLTGPVSLNFEGTLDGDSLK